MDLRLDTSDPVEKLVLRVLTGEAPDPEGILGNGRDLPPVVDVGHPSEGLEMISFVIDGFGPHDGPNEMDLEGKSVILQGGNGSGKSSIIYALNWCLTGTTGNMDPWTSEEERSRRLINFKRSLEEGMRVSMTLRSGERTYHIHRSLDRDGSIVRAEDFEGGSIDISSVPLKTSILPFMNYQGEMAMFLSMEGARPGEGLLNEMIRSAIGADELIRARDAINAMRDDVLDRIRSVEGDSGHMEGRLEEIRRRSEKLDEEIRISQKKENDLRDLRDRSRRSYLRMIDRANSERRGGEEVETRKALAATRAGRLEERITAALSAAPFSILGPAAERALKRFMDEKEKKIGMKMMAGALDAQMSILSEVISRKTCICGAPIGTTGMGRERLSHMMEMLRERKEEEARWGQDSIWSSDQFLSDVRSDLGSERVSGNEIAKWMGDLADSKRAMKDLEGVKGGEDGPLVRAVREMEKAKVKLQEQRKRTSALERERETVIGEMKRVERRLLSVYGNRGGKKALIASTEVMGSAMKRIDSLIDVRTEELRNSIERGASELISSITGNPDIGISIHPEGMMVGRSHGGEEGSAVIPMSQLSAGEREAVSISVVLSVADKLGLTPIIDSPFSNMESELAGKALKVTLDSGSDLLVSVPTGSIGELEGMISEISANTPVGMKLVRTDRGSVLEEGW